MKYERPSKICKYKHDIHTKNFEGTFPHINYVLFEEYRENILNNMLNLNIFFEISLFSNFSTCYMYYRNYAK